MRPLIVAIGSAGTGLRCSTVTSSNKLEDATTAAAVHLENSSVPQAYDNITVPLYRAFTFYQGAGGFCAAAELYNAQHYFAQGNIYLSQAIAAVRTDGGQP